MQIFLVLIVVLAVAVGLFYFMGKKQKPPTSPQQPQSPAPPQPASPSQGGPASPTQGGQP